MRNKSRVIMQCLCNIKSVNFYFTLECNTIFLSEPQYPYKNVTLYLKLVPYTPAFTSTTVARNEMVSLTDEIKKYDTGNLSLFCKNGT